MRALVVPTIRLASIKNFLDLWNPIKDWDVTIVVEDNPEKTFDIDVVTFLIGATTKVPVIPIGLFIV